MSNRVFLDVDSYNTLDEWASQNVNYVLIDDYFFKKCEIIFQQSEVVAYVEVKRYNQIRINIKMAKVQVAKLWIVRTPNGENHYEIKYEICTDDLSNEQMQPVIKTVSNAFFMINGYLFFGNTLENREIKAVGRNDGDDKVIVFRKHREKFYYIPVKPHKSPEGVFLVRGHIRHYKDGKDVWINEYFKGVDKEKEQKK